MYNTLPYGKDKLPPVISEASLGFNDRPGTIPLRCSAAGLKACAAARLRSGCHTEVNQYSHIIRIFAITGVFSFCPTSLPLSPTFTSKLHSQPVLNDPTCKLSVSKTQTLVLNLEDKQQITGLGRSRAITIIPKKSIHASIYFSGVSTNLTTLKFNK